MAQSLQLAPHPSEDQGGMRRLNRLPIIIAIVVLLLFIGIVVAGLSWRGLSLHRLAGEGEGATDPATSFGEQLKRGISDGIIGDPQELEAFQPVPPAPAHREDETRPPPTEEVVAGAPRQVPGEAAGTDWKERLQREGEEQYLRERNRQRMARLQAQATALDSPLKVDVAEVSRDSPAPGDDRQAASGGPGASDLASAIRSARLGQDSEPNGQAGKEDFFNRDIKELGYLQSPVVPQMSAFELKRGSIIPATMITGINSDLPGRISAQISQNVYDSATGRHLLIPQGAKLFGRYDSKVSFGQERVLVVWTDLILPNGSTLQLAGMSGSDAEGYGGFADKVDRHLWRTFGSAALIALIGTGIDASLPESSTLATQDSASDAARRNFAETFGRAAEQTISKNLNVQPTIRVRPGYRFNVLVDQDIVFQSAYREGN
jgi:type IV secretion system protein TrbI